MSASFNRSESIGWTEMLDRVSVIVKSLELGDLTPIRQEDRERVLSAMRAYLSESGDFKQFVQFSQVGYTKNLVTEIGNGLANVIVMCWAPRQASAFHGHEGSRCFVKVLEGELLEERMAHPNCGRRFDSTRDDECKHQGTIMRTNEVTYIDDSIGCHRVTNKSIDKPAVTLHVYTPPYRTCRLFELDAKLTAGELASIGQQDQPLSICMARSRTIDVTFNNTRANHQS